MGKYSDNLRKRMRTAEVQSQKERLQYAALIRMGQTHTGFRSHYDIRESLGDLNPQTSNLMDVEGFMTTTGRFVDRHQAQDVALVAGQISSRQGRPLLSSDIDW